MISQHSRDGQNPRPQVPAYRAPGGEVENPAAKRRGVDARVPMDPRGRRIEVRLSCPGILGGPIDTLGGMRNLWKASTTRPFGAPGLVAMELAALLLAVACTPLPTPQTRGRRIDSGIASWYGPGFHGRRTANGEVYDMLALTAAHKKLPFGTVVEVHNLDNGKSVVVRINDRGPFIRGRVIDLSRTAADAIEMLGPGTARVEIFLVSGTVESRFTVQVGAFRQLTGARDLYRQLAGPYDDVRILSSGDWHRVQVGILRTREEAKELRRRLWRAGHEGTVKEISEVEASRAESQGTEG